MKLILKILFPLLILALACGAAKSMIASKKSRPRRTPREIITTVDTLEISMATHQVPVTTFGTIEPYFETTLTPQVNGTIITLADEFRVGMTIEQGDLIAQIDPSDYRANLAIKEADLLTAHRNLEEETMRAKQARQEWLASGRSLETASNYVLRKPQLAAAKATISASQAAIDQARVDLKRTEIRAPYSAIVTQRNSSPGDFASSQKSIGTIISKDKLQLKVPLTSQQLSRINLSELSALIRLPNKPEQEWVSSSARLDSTIDAKNQVSYLILEFKTTDTKRLSVGQFVNVELKSETTSPMFKIEETALVDDSYVWLILSDMTLSKHHLSRQFSHNGFAYCAASNDTPEPLLIVKRPLTTFRSGISVQLKNTARNRSNSEQGKKKSKGKKQHSPSS